MYLYISYKYDFIMLNLGENIYITIDNVSVFERGSYLENIPETLL